MQKEFKLVISNGQLWCYILNQDVHLFSLGDWLASYQIPEKYSLSNETPFSDYGDLAVFQYKNFRREIYIKDNKIFDKSPFAEEITFKPQFSNSLLFRGDEDLEPITDDIEEISPTRFRRNNHPELLIAQKNREFRITVNLSDTRNKLAAVKTYKTWIRDKIKFFSSNKSIDKLYHNSLRSLFKLRMLTPDGEIKAAGFPDFPSLFGRDFAISALGEIYIDPHKVKEELKVHLKHIGKDDDVIRGRQFGRAVHEYNYDVETLSGKYRHFPSWYANDTNALLLITIFRLARIQNDYSLIQENSQDLQLLFDHMISLDKNGDGLIEYQQEPGQLLIHQTWRDGGDEITHSDDSKVLHPISPIHDQLCFFGALKEMVDYYDSTDEFPIDYSMQKLKNMHQSLKDTINEKYWMPKLGAYALALDGKGKQVQVVNSDVCFGYYYSVFPEERAKKQYEAIVDPNRLLDITGIRTVSKEHSSYSHKKYQRGGIWPWQLALTIAGFRKYNLDYAPLIDCLNTISKQGSIAEVYLSEQKNPIPLTSCIEQRWSAAVPWLAMIEGIFGLNVQYDESLELPSKVIDSEIGNIQIGDVIIRNRKYKMIVDKDRIPIIQR